MLLQYLPAVSIDMHGRFPFVLVRAADRSGMHKLLVRGKNGTTQHQLLQVGPWYRARLSQRRRCAAQSVERPKGCFAF